MNVVSWRHMIYWAITVFIALSLLSIIVDTGVSVMIRGCALDSGTLTTDTEIVRMSHCGAFYFNDK